MEEGGDEGISMCREDTGLGLEGSVMIKDKRFEHAKKYVTFLRRFFRPFQNSIP